MVCSSLQHVFIFPLFLLNILCIWRILSNIPLLTLSVIILRNPAILAPPRPIQPNPTQHVLAIIRTRWERPVQGRITANVAVGSCVLVAPSPGPPRIFGRRRGNGQLFLDHTGHTAGFFWSEVTYMWIVTGQREERHTVRRRLSIENHI